MRTGWFGELPADHMKGPLRLLVDGVAGVLDRLRPPEVASRSGLVDAASSAVVVPHARLPGCCLVLQLSDWSSSVGCWWSARTDPGGGPPTTELFAEFPLGPDGITRAVAWFERELRRPLVERFRHYGVVCRRDWLVELDDGYQLVLGQEWLPPWRRPSWVRGAGGERDAGWLVAPAPGEDGDRAAGDRVAGAAPAPADRWLLVAAGVAAVAAWDLPLVSPYLNVPSWAAPTGRVLRVAAFALLFTWFGVAALDRLRRVRVPMLAGLALSMLPPALAVLAGSAPLPSETDSALRTLGLFLRGWWPRLLGMAALACFLVAFLGMRGGGALRRRRWVLPVAVLAWLADLAVGLRELAAFAPPAGQRSWTLLGGLEVTARSVATGLAIALLLVVLDRAAGMAAVAVGAGVAGAALLAAAWAVSVQVVLSRLVGPPLPPPLTFALLSTPPGLALFAGTALLASAAAAEPPAAPPRRPAAR
jgi:hypothetical protein